MCWKVRNPPTVRVSNRSIRSTIYGRERRLMWNTVCGLPMFLDTWIECLGDLGRCRMAIEDDDIRDLPDVDCSRHWYFRD